MPLPSSTIYSELLLTMLFKFWRHLQSSSGISLKVSFLFDFRREEVKAKALPQFSKTFRKEIPCVSIFFHL
jgi:hypothetical protein